MKILTLLIDAFESAFVFCLLRTTDILGWSTLASKHLRPAILRLFGMRIGKGTFIRDGLIVESLRQPIFIGEHVFINHNSLIDAVAPIHIGDYCEIGMNVSLINGTHELKSRLDGARRPMSSSEPIIIEPYAWIGSNAVILGGVTVGKGSVVAAGSVVTKDIPSSVLVAGVPAKVIRQLN